MDQLSVYGKGYETHIQHQSAVPNYVLPSNNFFCRR